MVVRQKALTAQFLMAERKLSHCFLYGMPCLQLDESTHGETLILAILTGLLCGSIGMPETNTKLKIFPLFPSIEYIYRNGLLVVDIWILWSPYPMSTNLLIRTLQTVQENIYQMVNIFSHALNLNRRIVTITYGFGFFIC